MEKITLSTELNCPHCKDLVTVEQVDAYSFGSSLTREQRRKFKSIIDVWNRPVKSRDKYYRCPMCNNWISIQKWISFNKMISKGSSLEDASENMNNVPLTVDDVKLHAKSSRTDSLVGTDDEIIEAGENDVVASIKDGELVLDKYEDSENLEENSENLDRSSEDSDAPDLNGLGLFDCDVIFEDDESL